MFFFYIFLNLFFVCVDYKLGPEVLRKTCFQSNTQKVEATNRALRRSLPRNVTFSLNFYGRAHSAIHSVNNGPGVSIVKLCHRVGAPITGGSKVPCSLNRLQLIAKRRALYHKSPKAKRARSIKRHRMYRLYDTMSDKKLSKVTYRKGMLLHGVDPTRKSQTLVDHATNC